MGDFKVVLKEGATQFEQSSEVKERKEGVGRTYIHFFVQSLLVASPFRAFRTPSPGFQTNSRLTLLVLGWGANEDGDDEDRDEGRDNPPENLSNKA